MERIELDLVGRCVDRSLELLRRTYRSGGGGAGGWYHSLENERPGPSATGVGLSSFLIHRRPFEHRDECLEFLRDRQILSEDPRLDGGWAVNTSFGQPVTEVTALISRLLVVTRLALVPNAPSAARACQWLLRNQNPDGGWGSFHGQESRVWLTAMAVRAVSELNPTAPGLRLGADWLIKHRDPVEHAWGERPSQPPTVTHTAYALSALVDSGLAGADRTVTDAVDAGYTWLSTHLDPETVHDDRARVESYNVTKTTDEGRLLTWHSTVWHHGLPFAVSALVRQPHGASFDLLCRAVRTLVATQMHDGRWPAADSAAAFSVWSVWPFLEALSDVTSHSIFRNEDVLTWISPGVLLSQRGEDRELTVGRLLRRYRRKGWRRWLRRHWAVGVLVLFVAGGSALVLLAGLGWQEFALGMAVPVALLLVQLAMAHSRPER